MVKMKVKIITADELAHETRLIYLRKIDLSHRTNLKTSIHGGNIGGMWEQFIPIKEGVLWYFGENDKFPKFISNDICADIPKMIRDKERLMKSLKKHQSKVRK